MKYFSQTKECVLALLHMGLFFLITISPNLVYGELFINEILTAASEEDESGVPLEWIEIFNNGAEPVNLLGYTLSDDPLAPGKWMFGASEIPAKGFFRVWATGYDLLDTGNYHTNFKLNKDGETVGLYRPDLMEEDVIHYPVQKKAVSYGRYPDGGDSWFYYINPTPGASNPAEGVLGFSSAPSFSTEGGIYSNSISLVLSANEFDGQIRYTIDCSEPMETSARYESPIPVDKTMVIRARTFTQDFMPSPIVTHTFIFREKIVLPILSLVANPADLFSIAKGIYTNPSGSGKSWERPASAEYYSLNGKRVFQENCGIRIHGGASRTRSPKKSFRLYFRSEYGAGRLHYPLFPNAGVDKINQVVVRGGFNDTWGYDNSTQRGTAIYVKDQVVRDLYREMGQLACDGLFVELYVNGENWGIYNPTERIEDDFFYQHTGIEKWTIVADGGEVKDGDEALWNEYMRFGQRNSFKSPESLELFDSVIDRENFTAFLILIIWMQDYDWPHHNWLCARPTQSGGRWIFLPWDVEYSFGSGMGGYRVDIDVYSNALNPGAIGTLFKKIIANPDYQSYYWQQVDYYLKTVLSEENVTRCLNARLEEIRPAIDWESQKWGGRKSDDPARTPVDWETAAQLARDFIKLRTPIFLNQTEKAIGSRPVAVMDWQVY